MTVEAKILDDLLRAATTIAQARESAMDSCEEWDELNRAILAAGEEPGSASHEFAFGEFRRTARLRGGASETRACDEDDLQQAALSIEGMRGDWFTVDEVARDTQRDWIVAFIAIEFLRRVGMVLDGDDGRIRRAPGFAADIAVGHFSEAIDASERL